MKNKLLIPWAKPDIGIEEFKQIQSSFKSNWLTQGPKVKEFEKKMANFCNSKYGIAVSNGTSALDIAYKTLKIKEGDEVILPALSYFSTASMITYQKAIPVFVDIKQNNFNLDPQKIQQAISKRTKAIAFIDYGGNPSQLNEILNIGKKYNIKVLQDGAQSLGALYKGKPMGANTPISTMSFHMAKILSTVEGGMIFTNNKKFKNEIVMRRSHGEKKPGDYKHNILGYNARMTDLQAGIGLAQLDKLNFFVKKRQEVAKLYDSLFKNCTNCQPIVTDWNTSNVTHMHATFAHTEVAQPDVSSWDTSNVSSFKQMFLNAEKATPDTREWNVSNANNFTMMFQWLSMVFTDRSLICQ